MLLAIDIGNTMISLGVMKGLNVKARFQVESGLSGPQLKARLIRTLRAVRRQHPGIVEVVVCSVVPEVLRVTRAVLKKEWKTTALEIGRDLLVPIVNRYRNPKQVGQDRLVCAYAAMRLYGCPAVVVDLGTAITLELVSAKGEYLGGIIVPGIKMSAESLYQKTALLPRTEIREPRALIGTDTEGSILSGIFYGYGVMVSGLIELVRKKYKIRPQAIVTGGYTHIMRKYLQAKVVDTDLVFRGIALLWLESRGCGCGHCG